VHNTSSDAESSRGFHSLEAVTTKTKIGSQSDTLAPQGQANTYQTNNRKDVLPVFMKRRTMDHNAETNLFALENNINTAESRK
jgi:hypothetical protein